MSCITMLSHSITTLKHDAKKTFSGANNFPPTGDMKIIPQRQRYLDQRAGKRFDVGLFSLILSGHSTQVILF